MRREKTINQAREKSRATYTHVMNKPHGCVGQCVSDTLLSSRSRSQVVCDAQRKTRAASCLDQVHYGIVVE